MDVIDEDGYRANVGIVLCNKAGSVLLGGRKGQEGWQFPQGGIDIDEDVEVAMYRELHEEIGLAASDVEILGRTNCWLRYDLPKKYIRRHARPLCIGEEQRWFLLRLIGAEQRVRLDTTGLPEFDRWRWVDYWWPVKEVIYFKRQVYMQALHELAPILFPDGAPPRPSWWDDAWKQGYEE